MKIFKLGVSASLTVFLLLALGSTGRVNTASNVLMFGCSFAFQWGVGAVLDLYPVADGRYAQQGYSTAFCILAGLQIAALLWLLPLREKFQPPRL